MESEATVLGSVLLSIIVSIFNITLTIMKIVGLSELKNQTFSTHKIERYKIAFKNILKCF